ncbi:S66 family peptidase [Natrinema salaciae]|uniref:Muramoyltetrapeptide carboxypeptidase LdcA (Peptidoglycan recycling) n=1 Tax=Natrinema salaciae TaxID=1186196 RepID=A0A1H9T1G3_9EURY|nr:S66 peptidase family protein [Natrinema salaciae]SER90971.1 Muramoyltetrapeptide carboxypeptidase LdcA (peptidoglycan recycling) [Natrinema salaciae]
MNFVTPPALEPGDRVAVIAPSSGGARNAPHVFELALERLHTAFDLEPVVYPTARQSDDFLSAHPRARAADIHAAFRDPDISGVFATIGGADQLRVLRHLDPTVLREHPTRFYGMSDNTNLSLLLWNAGIVSYSGAQLMNELAVPGELPAYTECYCRRAFFDESLGELEPAAEWTDEPSTWWTNPDELRTPPAYEPNPGWDWRGGDGRVTGRVWGGCRAIVEWHLATDRYLPAPGALDGAILALETAEELPSPTDVAGTLMCLGERGLLERFAAVVVGRAPGRSFLEEPPREERAQYRSRVRDAITEQVERYNPAAPIVLGLDWGHTTPIAPLPIGAPLTVDTAAESLTVDG